MTPPCHGGRPSSILGILASLRAHRCRGKSERTTPSRHLSGEFIEPQEHRAGVVSRNREVWLFPLALDAREPQFESEFLDHFVRTTGWGCPNTPDPLFREGDMRCWLKESGVRKMSDTEAAWLAGFLDGEGSVSSFLGGRNYEYKTWRLSAPNTSLDSLKKCAEITGVGSVVVKREETERNKKIWQWQVGAQREIRDVLVQVLPYFIIKHGQAKIFLEEFREI